MKLIDLTAIEKADDLVQKQIKRERDEFFQAQRDNALKFSTFKPGDIVRTDIQGKEQAAMIASVEDYCPCEDEDDLTITHYTAVVKYGRTFNIFHAEGKHPDADTNRVRLVRRAKAIAEKGARAA